MTSNKHGVDRLFIADTIIIQVAISVSET